MEVIENSWEICKEVVGKDRNNKVVGKDRNNKEWAKEEWVKESKDKSNRDHLVKKVEAKEAVEMKWLRWTPTQKT